MPGQADGKGVPAIPPPPVSPPSRPRSQAIWPTRSRTNPPPPDRLRQGASRSMSSFPSTVSSAARAAPDPYHTSRGQRCNPKGRLASPHHARLLATPSTQAPRAAPHLQSPVRRPATPLQDRASREQQRAVPPAPSPTCSVHDSASDPILHEQPLPPKGASQHGSICSRGYVAPPRALGPQPRCTATMSLAGPRRRRIHLQQPPRHMISLAWDSCAPQVPPCTTLSQPPRNVAPPCAR